MRSAMPPCPGIRPLESLICSARLKPIPPGRRTRLRVAKASPPPRAAQSAAPGQTPHPARRRWRSQRRRYRPTSVESFLNLSSSSRTSKGMMTWLSAKVNKSRDCAGERWCRERKIWCSSGRQTFCHPCGAPVERCRPAGRGGGSGRAAARPWTRASDAPRD